MSEAGTLLSMICPECGSHNIVHDAFVRWSIEKQTWQMADVLDNAECLDCETSGNWIEQAVSLLSLPI